MYLGAVSHLDSLNATGGLKKKKKRNCHSMERNHESSSQWVTIVRILARMVE